METLIPIKILCKNKEKTDQYQYATLSREMPLVETLRRHLNMNKMKSWRGEKIHE